MIANTSGGRDGMGESALQRVFEGMDSSNDLISASMVYRKRSQEFAWVGFIKK
jgi:hypothetical protein